MLCSGIMRYVAVARQGEACRGEVVLVVICTSCIGWKEMFE